MKIHCLFTKRSDTEGVELLVAWDEYTRDENMEGWDEECQKASKQVQPAPVQYIDVEVDENELDKRFQSQPIPGQIKSS